MCDTPEREDKPLEDAFDHWSSAEHSAYLGSFLGSFIIIDDWDFRDKCIMIPGPTLLDVSGGHKIITGKSPDKI
jgi:hypothetical protein